MQINSLKLQSKFQVARPIRLKSEISHSSKKTLEATVGRSNNFQNSLQIQTTI